MALTLTIKVFLLDSLVWNKSSGILARKYVEYSPFMIDFTSNLRTLLRKFEKVNQTIIVLFICFVLCSSAANAAADYAKTLNESLQWILYFIV